MLYFEDFKIGQVRHIGSTRVSRKEIIEFATQFDPQPFHVDEKAARESIFRGLTASSCHTFALVSLIHHQKADQPIAVVANLGAESLKFPTPLRPDDEITLVSECIAMRASRSRPNLGIVTTRGTLTNHHGQTVLEMVTSFMVERMQPEPKSQ